MSAEPIQPGGRRAKYLKVAAVISVYLAISITLASVPAEALIDALGSSNAFLLMFVLGMIGGFTTFTGIPYHLVLMSLAAGGLNPIGLGVCTALGVMLGDSTMYLIGSRVKASLSPRLLATIARLAEQVLRHPKLVAPALVAYGAVSPFSNDFVVASLSVAGYSYWRTIIPLAMGNILYNVALAYLGLYAYDAIIGWF
ncbi:VTT domain-containing protein [Marivita sp. S2033]|uniref:VTT domain-containing protein n=1 Tax=Marivita sp. S2033 TaxID=3373187 RepID=UPI00398290B8